MRGGVLVNNIIINKAILHILDTAINTPVLSDELMAIDDEIEDFLSTHIDKLLSDSDIKECLFSSELNTVKSMMNDINDENFIENTRNLALDLFNIMYTNVDIPAGDTVFCEFIKNNTRYIGILKFNYKTSFIHSFVVNNDKRENKIIKQKAAIANEKQKLEECVFINLDDLNILVKEKSYEVNGERDFYITNHFLKADSKLSMKQQYNIVEKATKDIVKKYYNDDVSKYVEIKEVIKENIDSNNEIDMNEVTKKAFKNNEDIGEQYKQELSKKGLIEEKVRINESIEKRICKKQKMLTDDGIEINIPIELMNDNKLEFVMNEDGTISIIIKNVNNIKHK